MPNVFKRGNATWHVVHGTLNLRANSGSEPALFGCSIGTSDTSGTSSNNVRSQYMMKPPGFGNATRAARTRARGDQARCLAQGGRGRAFDSKAGERARRSIS